MTREEILKLERYLKKVFRLPELQVRQRPKKEDSAEVFIGEEFIAVLFLEDNGKSFAFQMAILDTDLDETAD